MRARLQALVLGVLLSASVLPRVPLLANAEVGLTSDEAVNALAVQHLLDGQEISAFSWDATYFGMVEGLLALPFVAVLGPTALAFKLGALVGFLFLVAAVFSLGRALYGVAEGLAAAALLVVFSPQLLLWSTMAISGFCLIVGWGTFTLVYLLRVLREPSALRYAVLGFLAGFGFYIFEMYLPYLALLAFAGAALLRVSRGRFPGHLAAAAAGFALGAAPKIAMFLDGSRGTKRPSYALASGEQMLWNARLLARDCIPALFGVNLRPEAPLEFEVGPGLGPVASGLGALLLLGYAAAWAWALVRVIRPSADGKRRWVEALLVVLVPLVALLFVLSPNPQDAGSNRYLMPWLSALPLAGAALVGLGRRSRAAGLAAGLLAVGLPVTQSAAWLIRQGLLTRDMEVVVKREPLRDLLPALESLGVAGGYAWYWDAYKATFLSGERLVFVPYRGWDRYPPYSRRLGQAERVAWIFPAQLPGSDPLEVAFLNQLESAGRTYRVLQASGYRIYLGNNGQRLLPPPLPQEAAPLTRPRAEFLSMRVPAQAAAGSELEVPIEVRNRSDAFWSSSGLPLEAHTYMVTASYRWLPADGSLVLTEGERSLLPGDVPVGGTLKMTVQVPVPAEPGRRVLRLTFVQEGVAWFDLVGGGHADRPIEVLPQANSLER